MKKFRGIYVKNDAEISVMRQAGGIVASILDELEKAVRPGVKTMLFEEMALGLCDQYGVKPAFKGYLGYPFALCCSVNEEVVHGFPSQRELCEGDIVSFDMGVILSGFYGDSARTVPVGEISEEAKKLLAVTEESLRLGIDQVQAEGNLYDVSLAIQKHVESQGYSVVRRFVGHGIGRNLHEKPEVPNFVPKGANPVVLKPGMTLAIEPMVTMGGPEVEILADKWTAVTKDRSLAAHCEHTVVVTADGPKILSQRLEA
ncbi:Methionine aminopeptidase 1 [Fundidesulfovibrio magnetotacticus]|uniref:Methionine aminopeptidase n=1 Tax=Fundidesulfovibrio magnetotacticus TaxID=2730080 RepID=A0A6V8LYI3_9BACT|nr:type I methionyl aminopeptidase [Fundidesulfovibrio magnetotacticus]GFK95651.1 Methionine aminopeptidase 1 [Fundidesulfovibrio magnetotacticus]